MLNFLWNPDTGVFEGQNTTWNWQPSSSVHAFGIYPPSVEWEVGTIDSEGGTIAQTSRGSTTLARIATLSGLAQKITDLLTGLVFQPTDWRPWGRYQYETSRAQKTALAPYPEPWYRFNSFGTALIGDRGNGVVNPAGSIAWDIPGIVNWKTDSGLSLFSPAPGPKVNQER